MRANSTMTTKALRQQPFNIVVAPSSSSAKGQLYIDDGVTLDPPQRSTTLAQLSFADNKLSVTGRFGFAPAPVVSGVTFLGMVKAPTSVSVNGRRVSGDQVKWNSTSQVVVVQPGGLRLNRGFNVELHF
jgi:alpha-glucosidase